MGSTAEFRIRRATPRDLGMLSEHRRNMFMEMGGKMKELSGSADPYIAWAKELMRKKLYHCYVVTDRRGRVSASGCVWLRQVQPSRGYPASLVPYLMSMYTVPEFRRKELASLIVREAMKWAKEKGYDHMTLHPSMTGRKVYSQLGWERTWEMEVDLE